MLDAILLIFAQAEQAQQLFIKGANVVLQKPAVRRAAEHKAPWPRRRDVSVLQAACARRGAGWTNTAQKLTSPEWLANKRSKMTRTKKDVFRRVSTDFDGFRRISTGILCSNFPQHEASTRQRIKGNSSRD